MDGNPLTLRLRALRVFHEIGQQQNGGKFWEHKWLAEWFSRSDMGIPLHWFILQFRLVKSVKVVNSNQASKTAPSLTPRVAL